MVKKIVLGFVVLLVVAIAGTLIYFQIDFSSGKRKVDQFYAQTRVEKLRDLGATKTLEIVPLVDWRTDRDDLKGEAGVSYLVKTDESVILFDVGLNQEREDPSPLLHNMAKLKVDPAKIDAIVISHNHVDHVGGFTWAGRQTFSLANRQIELGNKRVYTPVTMTYPGLKPIRAEQPTVISRGVATTGTLPGYLFFTGWTPEQSLVINVEGKGIVVIVGCGHQGVPRLLERVRQLCDEPIAGLAGGLHFPVTGSRVNVLGVPIQMVFGTGKPPWAPVTREEVEKTILTLQALRPKMIALSPHDSCDWSVGAFRRAFPFSFREIKVGKTLGIEDLVD